MTSTDRRLIVTFVLVVFLALGVVGLLRTTQPKPGPEHDTGQKKEAGSIQERAPEQEVPREQEAPRQEPKPRRQPTPRPAQEQAQSQPQVSTPEPDEEQGPRPPVVVNVHTIRGALDEYKSRVGAYPSTQQGLSVVGIALKDPWGNDYIYAYPSMRNRESYDLFSPGPDGIPDTPDDDWGEEGGESTEVAP